MLKMAYHLGVQHALSEVDINTMIKEAQELGIDLEKLAIPGLGTLGRSIMSGGKALKSGLGGLGKGIREGWKVGKDWSFGGNKMLAGLGGAGRGAQSALTGMSGLQRGMLGGAAGVGALGLGTGMMGAGGMAAAPIAEKAQDPDYWEGVKSRLNTTKDYLLG